MSDVIFGRMFLSNLVKGKHAIKHLERTPVEIFHQNLKQDLSGLSVFFLDDCAQNLASI